MGLISYKDLRIAVWDYRIVILTKSGAWVANILDLENMEPYVNAKYSLERYNYDTSFAEWDSMGSLVKMKKQLKEYEEKK